MTDCQICCKTTKKRSQIHFCSSSGEFRFVCLFVCLFKHGALTEQRCRSALNNSTIQQQEQLRWAVNKQQCNIYWEKRAFENKHPRGIIKAHGVHLSRRNGSLLSNAPGTPTFYSERGVDAWLDLRIGSVRQTRSLIFMNQAADTIIPQQPLLKLINGFRLGMQKNLRGTG